MIAFETTPASDGATVIGPTGRLDMIAAPQLKTLVQQAVTDGAGLVVIDLRDVAFIDSTGLSALISGLRTARQAGSDLRIAGAGTQVLMVLEMTRIDRVIRPYASVEDALGAR